MDLTQKFESEDQTTVSKKTFIIWKCGVRFGLFLALITLVFHLVEKSDHYFPLWPLTPRIYFSWAWDLLVSPLIYFAVGCLFGLVLWEFGMKKKPSST